MEETLKLVLNSTVVDLTNKPKILRPGIIDAKLISKVLNKKTNIEKSILKLNHLVC